MNLPLILAGTLGAFILLNKKKPVAKSKPSIKPEEKEIEDDGKDEISWEPDPKKEDPKKEETKPLPENPIYAELTKGRIGLIESLLKDPPLKINPQITPTIYIPVDPNLLDYSKWVVANPKGLYQGWLATMIYWIIAITEDKWDVGSNELPLMFTPTKKFEIATIEPPTFKYVTFSESLEQSDLRFAKGRKLWLEINEYVMNNLKICPNGAYCGPIIQKV